MTVIKVQEEMDIGGLAADTALRQDLSTMLQEAWIMSTDLTWSISGMAKGIGPITVGVSHSDLTPTQIKEALDASPTSDSDII